MSNHKRTQSDRSAVKAIMVSAAYLITVTAVVAESGNLVPNGSFEMENAGALAGWRPTGAYAEVIPNTTAGVAGGGMLYVWDSVSRGAGKGSLRLSADPLWPSSSALAISENIPVKPQTAYHFSLNYRGTGLVALNAGKRVNNKPVDCPLVVDVFFEKTGKFLGNKRIYLGSDADDWKLAEVDFTTPAGIEWCQIRIGLGNGLPQHSATAWVDDVSLTATGETTAEAASPDGWAERKPATPVNAPWNDPGALAADQPELGQRIQRTMKLLATSTAEHRHTVKVLFYGQSITAQEWSGLIVADLKRRYPNADIVWENRAIGGTTAEYLVNHAETDLYPFSPDLVAFAVYGGEKGELERIFQGIRERTTAEIITKTDHLAWPGNTAGDKMHRKADDTHSALIAQLAKKYDCELVDIRAMQAAFLEKTGLKDKTFLRWGDIIHLGPLGCDMFYRFYIPHFKYLPELKPSWRDAVKVYTPDGKRWLQDKEEYPTGCKPLEKTLRLEFEGNRIDLLAAPLEAAKLGTAKILIDGKKPSEFPELYAATRTGTLGWWWWPVLQQVQFGKNPLVEDWTITGKFSEKGKKFEYTVKGSKTGDDGAGNSDARFVSTSGRLTIDPVWFNMARSAPMGKKETGVFQTKFAAYLMGMDTWQPSPIQDKAKEDWYTLAQNLANGKHTLELTPNGDGPLALQAIVIHRPPLPNAKP